MSDFRLVPMTHRGACAWIEANHRHHKPPRGLIAAIGCIGASMHGVAVLGRPVARMSQDGATIELTRLCVDGTPNAASFLLGAARRLGFALGYNRIITYTLPSEGGASLRGAGYRLLGERGGGSWSRTDRPREDKHPLETKWLWEAHP